MERVVRRFQYGKDEGEGVSREEPETVAVEVFGTGVFANVPPAHVQALSLESVAAVAECKYGFGAFTTLARIETWVGIMETLREWQVDSPPILTAQLVSYIGDLYDQLETLGAFRRVSE